MTHQTTITKDAGNKKLIAVREFDGTPEKVWKAWTERELLEKWWAPKPWKAVTKSMDFKEGGEWLYYMQGTQGERHWCKVGFKTIDAQKSFTAENGFCDENGNYTNDLPMMYWKNEFSKTATGTKVTIEISFNNEEDLNKIVEMGFKDGFTMAHGNLDELLAK